MDSIKKFIFVHMLLILLFGGTILILNIRGKEVQYYISIGLLLYQYVIYVALFKTFPKNFYLLNYSIGFLHLINYRSLLTEFNLYQMIFVTAVTLQIFFLTYFKQIWTKYRESLTFEVSSTSLRKIIEKQFQLEDKLSRMQKTNFELDKQKILLNQIYSQTKIINSTLNFDDMIDLTKKILAEIIHLSNFVIWIKERESTETESYIIHNINEYMRNYLTYLEEEKMGKKFDIAIYSRVEIKNDMMFKRKYGYHDLSAVNILPLTVKDEQVGFILNFEQQGQHYDPLLIEDTKIALPQIAMGLKKAILYKKVEELSRKDGLTKLYLRRIFDEKLEEEFNRAKRYKDKLSLIILDIDLFKNFNDKYGHLVGDQVLIMVAETIEKHIPPPSIIARYGGEEFAAICPSLSKKQAFKLAEQIRKDLEKKKIKFNKKQLGVTISGGVAESNLKMKSKEILIAHADSALYKAKNSGRNKIHNFSKKG
ncbi:MAG: GGDEF domain-containing protein [Spirochaetes bacterium]|nr:GGDEF domain-containing protein [Spirochaetota bacterium]